MKAPQEDKPKMAPPPVPRQNQFLTRPGDPRFRKRAKDESLEESSGEEWPSHRTGLQTKPKLAHTANMPGVSKQGSNLALDSLNDWFSWPDGNCISQSNWGNTYNNFFLRYFMFIYRLIFAIWALVTIIWALSVGEKPVHIFVKTTGWAYMMTCVYFFAASYYTWKDKGRPNVRMTNGRKFTIALFEITFCWTAVVVFMYWAFLHNTDLKYHGAEKNMALVIHLHLLSLVWLTIDILCNVILVFPSHLVFIVGLACVNMAVNLIYFMASDVNSYSVLVYFFSFAGMILAFLIAFLLSVWKRRRQRSAPQYAEVSQGDGLSSSDESDF